MVQAIAVALVVAAVGGLVVTSGVVVDWREPVAASILLLTPFLVWHVASRVRRRLVALAFAYLAMLVVGAGVAVGSALVLAPTLAGFAGAVLGPLAGGIGFVLTSRHGLRPAPARVLRPAKRRPGPMVDTDTVPYMLPKEVRHLRDNDSLAG